MARSARHDRDRIRRVAEIFDRMMAAPPSEQERDMAVAKPYLSRVRILRLLASEAEIVENEPAPLRTADMQDVSESR